METNDLGDKKINNEQSVNEGFSGENIPENYNPAQMKTEYETDVHGNQARVERARNTDSTTVIDTDSGRSWNENQSLSSDVAGEEQKMVEHKDRNSDVATNRYPNEHPDNHENRGNLELDK